ncbi:MAG: phosphocholine cytidylyltransferase family protein [Anaerolineales bacterium]|nr:phosphocholine cytidylyltransferase family protein [Anaerolineales bacterium]
MKVIILAAGQGARLRPWTNDRPKCMVPFQGKPIIEWQLQALRKCGLQDIIVVRGFQAHRLDALDVRFVSNPEYETSNMVHSLFCAEQEMTEDILISYGDIVYDAEIIKKALNAPEPFVLPINTRWRELWDLRMKDPLEDVETLKLDADGYVREIGKRPKSYEEIEGQYMGLIKIEASVLERVKLHYHRLDRSRDYDGKDFKNMYMTSFLQTLIDDGFWLKAVPIPGGWVEIDSVADLNLPLRGA